MFIGQGYPRSIDRGLIEAFRRFDVWEKLLVYPRSIDRGLIEAYHPIG